MKKEDLKIGEVYWLEFYSGTANRWIIYITQVKNRERGDVGVYGYYTGIEDNTFTRRGMDSQLGAIKAITDGRIATTEEKNLLLQRLAKIHPEIADYLSKENYQIY